jgi:translation initiation factor IF-3
MAFQSQAVSILERFITDTAEHGQTEKTMDRQGRVISIVIAPKSSKK